MIRFSKPLILWEPLPQDDFARLCAMLGGDAALAEEIRAAASILRGGFTNTNSMRPWGLACIPLAVPGGGYLVLYRGEKQGFSWRQTLRAVDLRGMEHTSAEIFMEGVLPRRPELLPRDERFMEALHDTAFLTCLAHGARMRCVIDEEQQSLAEAMLAELLTGAVPPEHLRFVSFIAGTGELPQAGFQFSFGCPAAQEYAAETAAETACALVDFTALPPSLELRFQSLNFAQRAIRKLLPMLGRSVLLSMWNAAERTVLETMGAAAGESQDLIAWELLRHNFTPSRFPMTQEELNSLQEKMKVFEAAKAEDQSMRPASSILTPAPSQKE